MTPQAIQQLQQQLGVPITGVFDATTSAAMSKAVSAAVAANPDVKTYGGSNDAASILNAYTTGDWTGVTSLTGKPFTDEQQQAAVAQAQAALAPGFNAEQSKDTADTAASLQKTQEGFNDTEAKAATQFGVDKNTLDKSAADNGILFSGARAQKLGQLSKSYSDADAIARRNAGEDISNTARDYQYAYGGDATKNLSSLYSLPGAAGYNANVAGGKVTPARGIASVYNPSTYDYQGTKNVANTTAVQTRAANLLGNKANKLTLSGVGTKF